MGFKESKRNITKEMACEMFDSVVVISCELSGGKEVPKQFDHDDLKAGSDAIGDCYHHAIKIKKINAGLFTRS